MITENRIFHLFGLYVLLSLYFEWPFTWWAIGIMGFIIAFDTIIYILEYATIKIGGYGERAPIMDSVDEAEQWLLERAFNDIAYKRISNEVVHVHGTKAGILPMTAVHRVVVVDTDDDS